MQGSGSRSQQSRCPPTTHPIHLESRWWGLGPSQVDGASLLGLVVHNDAVLHSHLVHGRFKNKFEKGGGTRCLSAGLASHCTPIRGGVAVKGGARIKKAGGDELDVDCAPGIVGRVTGEVAILRGDSSVILVSSAEGTTAEQRGRVFVIREGATAGSGVGLDSA